MSRSYIKAQLFATFVLVATTTIAGAFLLSADVSANGDSVTDKVKIKVPVSCTMSGTGMNSHNKEILNGQYQANIGTTTLHAFCNDASGFAIYAAGYTGNTIGETNSNKLVGTSASNNATIVTGLATTAGNPDVSNWAMKLAMTQDSGNTTGTNAFTIDSDTEGSFSSYHTVPNEYIKVAHKNSSTDMTTNSGGVKLTTTYAAYISRSQPADTYTGQVIYTLVHPSDHNTPAAHPAILDTGQTVNAKLKSLAATVVNGEETTITPTFDPEDEEEGYNWDHTYAYDEYIKSIVVHLETPAPAGFTPSEKNTISTSTSKKPIYAVFDNTNDAGIMHFYTEGDQIVLSPDSSFMFYMLYELTGISGISDWDISSVTNMEYMFYENGTYVSTFTLNLSSWDTSNVTNMKHMFDYFGGSASTFDLNLSSWDTSNVTDMSYMFHSAGYSASTFNLDLSFWDTSSVTNMSGMFDSAGYSASTFNLDLSSWDTSNVMDMSCMFSYAGKSSSTFAVDLSTWDTSSVTSMEGMFQFAGYSATTWSISGLSDWDTSNVADMSYMFNAAGYPATTWSIGDLSVWDVSSVTNMEWMFAGAGHSVSTFTLDLSSWNTPSVTNMSFMFYEAGFSATTFSLDLSSWDTSSVTSMEGMFQYAGGQATTFTLDLSLWNTSSVTNMYAMFNRAGLSATTWSVTISPTNGNNISNTTSRLYGKTTSTYGKPPSGKAFTLAQP